MKSLFLALAAASAALFNGTAASAQTVDAARPETIVAALQAAGYKAVLEKDSTGDPQIKSAAAGAKFAIYFYGCTANANCTSVQFSAAYTVKPKLDLPKINEWNSKNRFAQAFLDKDGDPAIQFDVVTKGGMPAPLFTRSLELWVDAMGSYQTYIGF